MGEDFKKNRILLKYLPFSTSSDSWFSGFNIRCFSLPSDAMGRRQATQWIATVILVKLASSKS